MWQPRKQNSESVTYYKMCDLYSVTGGLNIGIELRLLMWIPFWNISCLVQRVPWSILYCMKCVSAFLVIKYMFLQIWVHESGVMERAWFHFLMVKIWICQAVLLFYILSRGVFFWQGILIKHAVAGGKVYIGDFFLILILKYSKWFKFEIFLKLIAPNAFLLDQVDKTGVLLWKTCLKFVMPFSAHMWKFSVFLFFTKKVRITPDENISIFARCLMQNT